MCGSGSHSIPGSQGNEKEDEVAEPSVTRPGGTVAIAAAAAAALHPTQPGSGMPTLAKSDQNGVQTHLALNVWQKD